MSVIKDRVKSLRSLMDKEGIHAYFIPSTDEHQNEYCPSRFRRREWISGFSGSSGDVVITRNNAGLWTDSRYYLQAEMQLENTGIDLHKIGESGVLPVHEWLAAELTRGMKLGLDGKLISHHDYLKFKASFKKVGIRFKFIRKNLVDVLWKDRPALQKHPVEILPLEYSGESFEDKLSRLRGKMEASKCSVHVLATLDSIAWLFNIRSRDIEFNPLSLAYAVITESEAKLYIASHKITDMLKNYFHGLVTLHDYKNFYRDLSIIGKQNLKVWVDPEKTNYTMVRTISTKSDCYFAGSAVDAFKSIKNRVEIEGIKSAHERDGAAMVRFLCWLDHNSSRMLITEKSATDKLLEFRSENALFQGLSFQTISAFGSHGAIVHYSPEVDEDKVLSSGGLYLVDSGAQYTDGTTDITRTVAIGVPSDEARRIYTLVLKGHIHLATTVFPRGTKCLQLDAFARRYLWQAGMDYRHGTGHGVGCYLNVHEIPPSISPLMRSFVNLEEGMVLSIEPGCYFRGKMGIRIENLYYIQRKQVPSEAGENFYEFKNLTCCPFDRNLIDANLLTEKEKIFINNYHLWVFDTLSPILKPDAIYWLMDMTQPI
ncbi:MAG: aminopeptidase P family protein [Spirochaetales bacterium]|nr:aminopeptidase P family protein [Spirochaetales bacterium]